MTLYKSLLESVFSFINKKGIIILQGWCEDEIRLVKAFETVPGTVSTQLMLVISSSIIIIRSLFIIAPLVISYTSWGLCIYYRKVKECSVEAPFQILYQTRPTRLGFCISFSSITSQYTRLSSWGFSISECVGVGRWAQSRQHYGGVSNDKKDNIKGFQNT